MICNLVKIMFFRSSIQIPNFIVIRQDNFEKTPSVELFSKPGIQRKPSYFSDKVENRNRIPSIVYKISINITSNVWTILATPVSQILKNTCTNTILVIPVLLTIIALQKKKIMFNILKCEKHANALTFLGYKVCSIHLTEDIGL